MKYIFASERPIYLQIMEIMKNDIINGKYKIGEKIPSVRELAINLQVNPNTIVKSLYFLETEGLIYTDRTNGKYVTENLELIEKYKENTLKQKVDNFLNDIKSMGYTKEEVIKLLMEENNGRI